MPHPDEFYRWHDRVQALFPDLKEHHRRSLAEYSFGMTLAGCCGLTSVVADLGAFLAIGAHALQQRLRELDRPAHAQRGSARSEFDPTLCFAPLVRWAASGRKDRRLVLALDPTNLTDRFRVLCVSVLSRGCGLPVAWAVQSADQKGSWNAIGEELLGKLKAALGEGGKVLVLTDRGLESKGLFETIVGLGWHPLMRVKAGGQFRPEGWRKGHRMAGFARLEGRRWAGGGTAYPTGARLGCTLLACWEAGHAEPWLILTDLAPGGAAAAWYAWRMWAEQGYRAIKRGQWQGQRTQMGDPARVARLWAVIAVAMLWAVDVGGEGEAAELPEIPPPLSGLKVGLMRLRIALMRGEPRPMPSGRLIHHDWPKQDWQPDSLTEPMMDQC
jgi:hypothetical protein